jgi:hypothetical protein
VPGPQKIEIDEHLPCESLIVEGGSPLEHGFVVRPRSFEVAQDVMGLPVRPNRLQREARPRCVRSVKNALEVLERGARRVHGQGAATCACAVLNRQRPRARGVGVIGKVFDGLLTVPICSG